ncbi:amidohydrolase family protein [Pontibacter mangrovi]|uniref:Amidohydrolase family protein n=1 Tax=Pontibacter mangrovi TaxID=2589816 RepID=A0A501VZE9_9BACT|nr:amidohydrolase family protein [Pontibacter mangrovi]TPE42408.1 amidohydrolase family protein [Pontibacter mangrovi]
MKLLRRIIKIALIFTGLLLVSLLAILGVDGLKTGYLNIMDNELAMDDSYLFTHVNVVPMTEDTVLRDKAVYIKNGIIHAIADSMEVQGVEVIDGRNKYLLPGLIDMHVHLWDKYELGLYLSNGVTAVRNVWGMPMHLRLKKEINNDKILSPLLYTTGPKLTGPEFIGDDNLQLFSPQEARDKVRSYKARGYDFIKTYYGLPKDIFDAVIVQAKLSGMDIVAHPSQKVPYAYHFNPQIASIEHAEDIVQQPLHYELDSLKLAQVVKEFSESPHTSFCPTLMAFYNICRMLADDNILSSEPVRFMNPAIRKLDSKAQFDRWRAAKKENPAVVDRTKKQHDFHLYAIKKLNDAGVNIICGTDAGIGVTVPGFSIHQELSLYKEAGLSNYEALKTATVNASKTHQIMHHMGTIETGKTANLLLVNDNPLVDLAILRKPQTVFIKGRRLDRPALDTFEEKANNRSNLMATVVRYVENTVYAISNR